MSFSELKDELGMNFINYAMAVNSDRSIPDAKTGLKPVARRILYSTFMKGRTSNKPHVKSARIVGDVMGELHPHGQDAIYGALIRLSQDWVMRYPLIDVHGNKGNIDGDPPAAMRYTESRLSKLSEEGMLKGIKKKNVDFIPNYDEQDEEPVTLPAIFPNLLCNPNLGIGVALATHFLPHNLKEVAQSIFDYLDGKEINYLAADFPTGGVIINKDDIPNIVKTGKGSLKVRGKYNIDKQSIIFYEIPYEVNAEDIIDEIGKACDEKKIEGITEIRNESNKKGLRIVIECEKGINPESIVKLLFAKTSLQTSISYNQVALVDGVPTELKLVDCIKIYINHNIDCLIKETKFDLIKAKDRLEIVEGLLKALEIIDNIIKLIKSSKSAAAAKDNLIEKYKFTEPQAKAIVDMKLGKIAGLEKIELQNEDAALRSEIENLNNILSSKEIQVRVIRERLSALVEKYGDDRKTEVIQLNTSKEEKEIETVIPEETVVILTQTGNVKRIPRKSFRTQKRNGKGVKTKNDAILASISTNTIDNLLLFSSKGKMYRLLVDKVPQGTNATKGTNINNFISLDSEEEIIAATSLDSKEKAKYIVFFTKNGMIKKTSIEEYKTIKKGSSKGTAAIKLKEEDSIANVLFMNEEDVIVVTKKGMSIHFPTAEIRAIGKGGQGVRAIALKEEDEVLAGVAIDNLEKELALFLADGIGKRCKVSEFVSQGRGGKGILCSKAERELSAAVLVDENDSLLLSGKTNAICICAKELPLLSRVSMGNQMVKGDIISVVKL